MVNKRPLSDYLQPVHDADCEVYRNKHSPTTLDAATIDQVMGIPRCTCGLNAARGQRPDEIPTQCQYHFGETTDCRLIQLNHYTRAGEWQAPMWMCERCRSHVLGNFRYVTVKI